MTFLLRQCGCTYKTEKSSYPFVEFRELASSPAVKRTYLENFDEIENGSKVLETCISGRLDALSYPARKSNHFPTVSR